MSDFRALRSISSTIPWLSWTNLNRRNHSRVQFFILMHFSYILKKKEPVRRCWFASMISPPAGVEVLCRGYILESHLLLALCKLFWMMEANMVSRNIHSLHGQMQSKSHHTRYYSLLLIQVLNVSLVPG